MGLDPPFVYPASELDERAKLQAMIGSFWADIFNDETVLSSFLHARAQLDAQTQLTLMELLHSISRFSVPVYHTDNWYLLTLREADKDEVDIANPQFDGAFTFGDPAMLSFGDTLQSPYSAWTVPADLKQAPVILNRIVAPSLTLSHGIDYSLQGGAILFRENPFENPYVPIREIYEDNRVIDREFQLWVYRGQFEWHTLSQQFGAVLGLRLPSSQQYKQLLNAVFDGITEGGSLRNVLSALSAVCDVPLVQEDGEIVENVMVDARSRWVVTDKRAYEFHIDASVDVAVGDVLRAGDAMTGSLVYYEFNRGQTPTAEQLRSLVLGKGYLSSGFFGDLVFENKDVPLIVEGPNPDTGNYTKVSFEIHGAPADVEKFWNDVHEAGVASGQTLAMLLDTRGEKVEQPTAANLPTTVNPVDFLCKNLLRSNYGVVVVNVSTLGRNALGLHHARILRKIIPPHTAILIYAELEYGTDEIIMEGSGDENGPGVEEDLLTFLNGTFTDEIDPADLVEERVRFRQITGICI